MYDIIIVGGGPAGMTAALYAQRNGKHALIIEKAGFGGQITQAPRVENFPGSLKMSGNEFADKFLDQIMAQGAEVELAEVTSIQDGGRTKFVTTDDGNTYEAKTVILATGVRHRMLGLPGEDDLVGNGISFCAVCDGDFFAGKTVCVAGGENSALQEAILLSSKCKQVIILQDMAYLTGEKKLQEIVNFKHNIEVRYGMRIMAVNSKDGAFSGVTVVDTLHGKSGGAYDIEADGLFVAIGLIPENEAFKNLVRINSHGYFDAEEDCLTKTPGVFVAGDARAKRIRQLTTAVCDGANAAMAACNYIDAM